MNKKAIIIWTALTGAFVCAIFVHSMMPADISSDESAYAMGVLGSLLDRVGFGGAELTERLIRKSAHYIEYTVLGILLAITIDKWKMRGERKWFRIGLLGIVIPFIDETIQLFSPGRSSQTTDMWIDIGGVATGILLVELIRKIRDKGKKKPRKRGRYNEMSSM